MMTDPSRDNITDGVTARETSTKMAQTSTSIGTRPSTVEDMITDASTDVLTDGVTARETASVTAQTFISSGTAPSTIEDMMIDPATDVITDLVTARETSFVTAQSPTPSGTGTFTAEDATTRAVTNMTTNRSVIQDTSAVIAETSSLSGTLISTERRRTDVSIALISSVANLRAERCIFCQEIDDNGECIDDDGFTTCDILEDEICISVNVTFTTKGSKNRQVSRGCIAKVFFGVTSSGCISVEEYTTALGFDPVEEPSSGEACFCDEEDLCNTHSLSETIILRLAPNVPGGNVTIEWFIIGEGLDFEGFYVEVQYEESEQWVRLSSFLGADVRNFTVESLENVTGIRIVAIDQSKSEVARSIQIPIRSVESGTYENMDRNVSELILVPAASLLVFVAFAAIVLKLRKANLLKETPR